MKDPYEVLGVGRDATEGDIKTAFRRLAMRHHPDQNPNDPEAQARFKEINAAYQILSDAGRRAAFDRFGGAPGEADFVDLGAMGLDGLFGDLLGALGIRTGDRGDVRHKLRVSFEDAVLGCQKDFAYERLDLCNRCSGGCAEPGSPVDVCRACGGRGRVRFQQGIFPLPVERSCSACRGLGRIPSVPCTSCSGRGLQKTPRTLEVTLPPGIEHGATRLINGAGNRSRADRPAGDLEIVVEVMQHPFFRREHDDIVCAVPISFCQAALGGEIDVPSVEGKLKVRVPPATQPGSTLRVRGKGVPHRYRSGRGDQLVEVAVEIPTQLSPRARELIEELAQELGEDVQPQQRSFLEKLKSLFD